MVDCDFIFSQAEQIANHNSYQSFIFKRPSEQKLNRIKKAAVRSKPHHAPGSLLPVQTYTVALVAAHAIRWFWFQLAAAFPKGDGKICSSRNRI